MIGAVILKKGGGLKISGATLKTPFSCKVALLMRCEKLINVSIILLTSPSLAASNNDSIELLKVHPPILALGLGIGIYLLDGV